CSGILARFAELPAQPRRDPGDRGGAGRCGSVCRAVAPCRSRKTVRFSEALSPMSSRCRFTGPILLPMPAILSKYRLSPRRFPRVDYGRTEKESFAVAAQNASLASCFEPGSLCRMPELRRAEAPASPLRGLRAVRWPRGDAATQIGRASGRERV